MEELGDNYEFNEEIVAEHNGREYFFCSEECKQEFIKNPGKYVITKQDGRGC